MTILELAKLRSIDKKEPVGSAVFFHVLNVALKAAEVRQAQVVYFKTRERSDLIESKNLEAELDRLIHEEAGLTH